ncbi:MAG: glutamyl-tRNA reductase [Nitrospirae bacterium]|nr:glutamyl-tRNA reductase [Nitrospirota bacterium]
MKVLVIGLNHKTADVEVREKLAFNGEKLELGVLRLREIPEVKEVSVLSTCNRVEMYICAIDTESAIEKIKLFLAEFHNLNRSSFDPHLYILSETEAVRHIFRVASSLDSMVLGEPQILGQLKDAFDFSLEKKTTGVMMNKLMKKAISTAKRVRTETRIAENAVSISFAAVELARKIFKELSGTSCMLLGAGEMAELAARHLVNNGVSNVMVANRTYERGCELAKEFKGKPVKYEDFINELVHVDIIICSTGAPTYVLKKEHMHKVMKERRHKPVFLIDISVPRNIDPEINNLDSVYLYNVDDLQEVIDTNILERQKEAAKAEAIVLEEVEKFVKWVSSLDSVPVIVALRQKAEEIKKEELEKLKNKLPNIDEATMKALEYTAGAIVNKLIHPPTAAMKDDSNDRDEAVALIKKIYGINGDDGEE